MELFAPLVVGFLGSFHCLGMCGPLVFAYSLNIQKQRDGSLWRRAFSHHAAFHSGRIVSYGILGTLAGAMAHFSVSMAFLDQFRGIATTAIGLGMLFFGLILLRVFSINGFVFAPVGYRLIGRLVVSKRALSKCLLGFGAGFLPCMLPWAMLLQAVSSGNPATGFATMVLFGLGTVPVLLFPGASASIFSVKIRLLGERLAGISVMVMGIILVWKGARYFLG